MSTAARDWAAKRRAQIEAAKALREEIKDKVTEHHTFRPDIRANASPRTTSPRNAQTTSSGEGSEVLSSRSGGTPRNSHRSTLNLAAGATEALSSSASGAAAESGAAVGSKPRSPRPSAGRLTRVSSETDDGSRLAQAARSSRPGTRLFLPSRPSFSAAASVATAPAAEHRPFSQHERQQRRSLTQSSRVQSSPLSPPTEVRAATPAPAKAAPPASETATAASSNSTGQVPAALLEGISLLSNRQTRSCFMETVLEVDEAVDEVVADAAEALLADLRNDEADNDAAVTAFGFSLGPKAAAGGADSAAGDGVGGDGGFSQGYSLDPGSVGLLERATAAAENARTAIAGCCRQAEVAATAAALAAGGLQSPRSPNKVSIERMTTIPVQSLLPESVEMEVATIKTYQEGELVVGAPRFSWWEVVAASMRCCSSVSSLGKDRLAELAGDPEPDAEPERPESGGDPETPTKQQRELLIGPAAPQQSFGLDLPLSQQESDPRGDGVMPSLCAQLRALRERLEESHAQEKARHVTFAGTVGSLEQKCAKLEERLVAMQDAGKEVHRYVSGLHGEATSTESSDGFTGEGDTPTRQMIPPLPTPPPGAAPLPKPAVATPTSTLEEIPEDAPWLPVPATNPTTFAATVSATSSPPAPHGSHFSEAGSAVHIDNEGAHEQLPALEDGHANGEPSLPIPSSATRLDDGWQKEIYNPKRASSHASPSEATPSLELPRLREDLPEKRPDPDVMRFAMNMHSVVEALRIKSGVPSPVVRPPSQTSLASGSGMELLTLDEDRSLQHVHSEMSDSIGPSASVDASAFSPPDSVEATCQFTDFGSFVMNPPMIMRPALEGTDSPHLQQLVAVDDVGRNTTCHGSNHVRSQSRSVVLPSADSGSDQNQDIRKTSKEVESPAVRLQGESFSDMVRRCSSEVQRAWSDASRADSTSVHDCSDATGDEPGSATLDELRMVAKDLRAHLGSPHSAREKLEKLVDRLSEVSLRSSSRSPRMSRGPSSCGFGRQTPSHCGSSSDVFQALCHGGRPPQAQDQSAQFNDERDVVFSG